MSKSTPLELATVDQKLSELPGWRREDDVLVKTFTFGSFREAMSFMVRISFEAEALNHHPEWTNVYDEVSIRLCTHGAGNKITDNDLLLATAIERINWMK